MWDLITNERFIETKDICCEILKNNILQVRYKDNCVINYNIAQNSMKFMSVFLKQNTRSVLLDFRDIGKMSLRSGYYIFDYIQKNVTQPVAFLLENQKKAAIILFLLKITKITKPLKYFCQEDKAKNWLYSHSVKK